MEDRSDITTNGKAGGAPLTYSLSLKGDGMTVDRKIDEATALEVLALVMSGGGDTTTRTDTPTVTQRTRQTSSRRVGGQSLREYLDEVAAKRNPDKILAIARHTIDGSDKSTVTRDEVRGRFKDAAEKVPGNYARDFRWVVKNGWLAPDTADKNEFYVTDTGKAAIKEKFSAEVKKKTGVAKGRRGGKRRTKKTTPTNGS